MCEICCFQYSSFIFYHNDQQKLDAETTLNEKKAKGLDILTKIEPASQFFNAEEYDNKLFFVYNFVINRILSYF